MIPKIIHYCWFGGGNKPKLTQKCIESWKNLCPDYKIVEWNESNFDVNMNEYTKMCMAQGKWAFLSDYVRLLVVYQNGGIYFDTDVEVIRSFDELLQNEAFYGFENEQFINTGLGFGAQKEHPSVQAMINEYDCVINGKPETIMCPKLNTNALLPFGLQQNGKNQTIAHNTKIYSSEYFNPLDDATGLLNITHNTYSINRYGKSWMNKGLKFRSRLTRPLHRILGTDFFRQH